LWAERVAGVVLLGLLAVVVVLSWVLEKGEKQ